MVMSRVKELGSFMKGDNMTVAAEHRTQRPNSCCLRVPDFSLGNQEEPVPDSCPLQLESVPSFISILSLSLTLECFKMFFG